MTFKRSILYCILFPVLVLFISGCDDEENTTNGPVACFSIADEELFVSETTFFDGRCSKNYDSIRWYMGDGAIVSSTSHSYAYKTSGTYVMSIVAYKGIEKDSTVSEITVLQPTIILHDQEAIWADAVWEEGIHEINGFVSVIGGTLTIEPGTIIRLRPGASFQVGVQDASGVVAEGTASKPIIWTSSLESPTPGAWNHVVVAEYTTSANFKHCIFEYGGDGPYGGMITAVYGSSFSAENCTFRYSSNDAVYLRDESYFDLFSNNIIHDINGYAIRMKPYQTNTIGVNNDIDSKGILLETEFLEDDLTLESQTTPYVFETDLTLGSASGTTLTLEPGTTLAFANAGSLRIGWGNGQYGRLIAEGTATDSVTFTSSGSPSWGGIWFSDNAEPSTLQYANIINTASFANGDAAIKAYDVSLAIDNSTIQGDKLYGLDLTFDTKLTSFKNNVVDAGSKFSMRVTNESLAVFEGNSFPLGKDIWLLMGLINQPTTTWKDLGVAYYIPSDIYIGSDAGATMILEPGVTLRMKSGTSVSVGSFSDDIGTLIAMGTETDPVTFEFAEETATDTYPDWEGIRIHDTVGPETILDYVRVQGAENGVELSSCPDGLPVISNSIFEDITEYGIMSWSSSPTLVNNTFINIGWDDVKYH